jgi:hypothetical protein
MIAESVARCIQSWILVLLAFDGARFTPTGSLWY